LLTKRRVEELDVKRDDFITPDELDG